MISVQTVSKKFGSVVALDNISFEVTPGEFIFLTGPSGSGKTTLFRLLIRDLVPDSGLIQIDSQDLGKLKNSATPHYRRQIGIVFQDNRLLPDRTVFENVSLPLELSGSKKKLMKEMVTNSLETVGLKEKINVFPAQLSGGELQRVGLARAIVSSPKLILADEPTGNLDPKNSKSIISLIEKIQTQHKTTVIIATHNADIVNSLQKRVIHLDSGKLVKDSQKSKYHE